MICLSSSRRRLAQAAAALAVGWLAPAIAQTIDGVAITNRSTADRLIESTTRVQEFRTESDLTFGPDDGNSASLTHRMAWGSAHRVEPDGPTVALLWGNSVDYTIGFQVADPLSRGYDLSFDTLMRGLLTAQWSGNSGSGVSMVFGAGTLMNATFDDGTGPTALPDLVTDIDVAVATDTEPFDNLLVERAASLAVGQYVGTRFFSLSFTTVGANTQAAFQNFNTGEVAVRFGAELTSPRFEVAGYPGVDGWDPLDLGHFVTARVNYLSALPDDTPGGGGGGDGGGQGGEVPEPASLALLLSGLLAAGGTARSRTRR